MDGTQTPGINYNSIDGLTTVSANSIIINGSTINLASYVPYVGATTNVDLNTKLLRNIGNAISPQDAVAFSQLGTYVPYTGATSNVNLNAKQLKNILNASDPQDAVAFSQLGTYVPYSGATSNVDLNTRLLTNIGDGVSNNDAISLQQLNAKRYDTIQNGAASVYVNCGLSNLTLQATAAGRVDIGTRVRIWPTDTDAIDTFEVRNFSGASKFYVDTTAGNRSQFTTALTVRTSANATAAFDVKDSALTSLFTINTTTPTINCLTTTSMNSNKITNLANGTVSGDAVNFGQLSTISSLIPAALPAGSIQGSYIVYDGTSYVNQTSPVYLGASPGKTGSGSINIGSLAGLFSSATDRIAMGTSAGYDSQATTCIAIGSGAGNNGQLESAIAVGYEAGRSVQGRNSVAIGAFAGYANQHASSIVINATGVALDSAVSAATYIAPIRQVPTAESDPRQLMYKLDTKEIIYNQTIIFNVLIIGQATADPNATVPLVYFAPTGVRPSFGGFTCTVARAAQGRYTLTFPAGSNPNFGTFTTVTIGTNSEITTPVGGSKISTARITAINTVDICYVNADAAFTDLQLAEKISLRIEF
jgi:ribosomal protein S16